MLKDRGPRMRMKNRLLRGQRIYPRSSFRARTRRRRLNQAGFTAMAVLTLLLLAYIFTQPGDAPSAEAMSTTRSGPAAPTLVEGSVAVPIPAAAPRSRLERPPDAVLARLPATRADLTRLREKAAALDDLGSLREWVSASGQPLADPRNAERAYKLHYTLHPELSDSILRLLERQKVGLGQVLVADAQSGRMLAYAVTNPERFGPRQTYPAASLAKVITAAAVLQESPDAFDRTCVFTGNPYRLTRSRLQAPKRGHQVSLIKALATSNNQCFGRLAAHTLGADRLQSAFSSFGWITPAVPGYPAGRIEAEDDAYALAQLGSGLAGSSITPLHAMKLALSLVEGKVPEPFWIRSVEDGAGRPLELPERRSPERVMPKRTAETLRSMLVETTVRGTARRAFRLRSGRPLLQTVTVAGKTGSLSGTNPAGRYEWFVGVAPADAPRIAIAVVTVHGDFFLQTSSQLAAEVLRAMFCPKGVCAPDAAADWLEPIPVVDRNDGLDANADDSAVAPPS